MTITEFLEARIAEDEAQATKHLPSLSSHGLGDYGLRVLAECAAKRAIINNYNSCAEWAEAADCPSPQSYRDIAVGAGESVRALAAVYKDHPDYQQEWAA